VNIVKRYDLIENLMEIFFLVLKKHIVPPFPNCPKDKLRYCSPRNLLFTPPLKKIFYRGMHRKTEAKKG